MMIIRDGDRLSPLAACLSLPLPHSLSLSLISSSFSFSPVVVLLEHNNHPRLVAHVDTYERTASAGGEERRESRDQTQSQKENQRTREEKEKSENTAISLLSSVFCYW